MYSRLTVGLAIVALASVLSACAENGFGSRSTQPTTRTAPTDQSSVNAPGAPLGRQ